MSGYGVQAEIAGVVNQKDGPVRIGDSIDVVLSAEAALVWDEESGEILYTKNADEARPVASLSKLVSALVVREKMNVNDVVDIPIEVRKVQRMGANIRLPVGDRVSVYDLLGASMTASANDAIVALAISISGSEEAFVNEANDFARRNGAWQTQISNATGLAGGEQRSTANDMRKIFSLAYRDKMLRNMLVTKRATLITEGGVKRSYRSTNQLLGTYFPVLAAKTGYTKEAGENLVVMTFGEEGQRVGAVVLGSKSRFQDMKTLVEWVWRSYEWP